MGMALPQELVRALLKLLGEHRVILGAEPLRKFGSDYTEDLYFQPQVAVLPETTQEVSRILELAGQYRIPVTPRGAGTGLSGGALPVQGGIVLSLERLNRSDCFIHRIPHRAEARSWGGTWPSARVVPAQSNTE